jgi:nitrate/nitrite transporter NarK
MYQNFIKPKRLFYQVFLSKKNDELQQLYLNNWGQIIGVRVKLNYQFNLNFTLTPITAGQL